MNKILSSLFVFVLVVGPSIANAQNPIVDQFIQEEETIQEQREGVRTKFPRMQLDNSLPNVQERRAGVIENTQQKREEVRTNVQERREEIKTNVSERRSEIKENVQQRKEEVRANISERRDVRKEALQQRLETRKANVAERRATLSENRKERVKQFVGNINVAFDNVIEKLYSTSDRISEKINDMESQGLNTGNASSLLNNSINLIADAEAEVKAVQELIDSSVENETSSEEIRTLVNAARESIQTARESFRDVLDELKNSIRENEASTSDENEE